MTSVTEGVPFSAWDGSAGDLFPTNDEVGGVPLKSGNVVFRVDTNEFYRFDAAPAVYTLL